MSFRLNKFKKQAVHSFIKAWNSLLQLLGFLIILALVIITIIVYCTQVPWNNLGLLFELLTSLTLLASSTVVAILSKRTNRNILEMPPKTEEEKYEEKEVLNAEP